MDHETTFPSGRAPARGLIVLMLMSLAFLGHFNRVSISVAGNERFIQEGLISEPRMGQIYTVFLLVYTACMLPAGWFIDRRGPTTALAWMAVGMGACIVLTGAIGWCDLESSGFWMALLVVRGIAGAASTPLHPGAARGIFLWISPGQRNRANGMVTAGALLGIAASYPLFGWLMDQVDWPGAFVICGLTMIASGGVWRRIARNSPADLPLEVAGQLAQSDAVATDRVPLGEAPPRWSQLFRHPPLILLSLSYAAVGYFQYLFFYWIEYYFDNSLNLPTEQSRRAASIVMLAMAAGMASGGWLADGISARWGLRAGRRTLAVGGMLLSSLFAILGVSAELPAHVILWFSLALGALGMCEGVFWTSAAELGGRVGGTAAAFLNTFGNAGGALAPWLTAVLIRNAGWHVAIGVACVVCSLGGLLWFCFDPTPAHDD